ncbi:RNA polymerase sigma-70 factor protein [Rhizobium phage RHph_X2_25]|nr:RNA polymerase sigma-70 factor protein [Rhizobium phage RHph_X2_25]
MNDNNPPQRPASFDAMLTANWKKLRKYALLITPTADEADAVMSDMTEAVLANWKSYRSDGDFVTWCKLTIRSKARNRRRKPHMQHEHVEVDAESLVYGAGQEHLVEAASALQSIDRDTASLVILAAAGHSHAAIGKMIGRTGERVCQRLKQARATMRAAA